MFKLATGLPGEGKTSNELWDFLNAPEYQGRPKYCTPINGFEPEKHGVKPIEHIKVWQDLPDGSVIFCDEVQDFCGSDQFKEPPEWVKQIARHRHRGFDFIVTTQSPMFIHPFVRKLSKPHVHYHRPWNMKGVRYTFEAAQNDPLAKSSKALAQKKFVTPNPEVFKLYTSTVLDTHKSKPPKKLIVSAILAMLFLVLGGGYAAYKVMHFGKDAQKQINPAAVQDIAATKSVPTTKSDLITPPTLPDRPVWTEDSVKPRIKGQAFTAPIYDNLTAPTDFPRVAACMSSKSKGCHCYTQQATPLDIPEGACEVFVRVGNFDPWLSSRRQQQQVAAKQSPASEQQQVASADPLSRGQKYTVVGDTETPARPWRAHQ
ncbi:zonular occludens toxin domain-containing protein [Pseudomonas sp. UBA1879]|uniref:zonular occludens toxin domain-containing protein n=1 Tax=Pseudomonas sp. UBA1879 TaxID=1947305 RepID=UPI0025EFE670|nr:zonular occludens toxin domain-containing protein [Pseudomonas sp. UBA1879]